MIKQHLVHTIEKLRVNSPILILLSLLLFTAQATSTTARPQIEQPNEDDLPTVMVWIDLTEGESTGEVLVPMTISNPDAMGDGSIPLDSGHEDNPLTIVLDFIDPAQTNGSDAIGNVVSSFDVTQYGFAANQYNTVVDAITETVREHYFKILTTEQHAPSPLPAGKDLAIDVVVGDVGTPPSNGATEYYYLLIGTAVSGPCASALGCAATRSIRNESGTGPNLGLSNGAVVGSIFADNINTLSFLTPSNALTSGNIDFTRHAIAGTTSHELGHAISLLHLNKAGSMTPTGLPPLMGTGAIDLPNQDRITDRDFAISGQNSQETGTPTKFHIQQLMDAVDVHNSEDLGDAPDSYDSLRTSDGARHLATGPYLGTLRDTEADANSPLDGLGDDMVGVDDDDGITISMLIPDGTNQTATMTVQSSASAFLDAWIDFDRDGIFDHPTEHLNGGTSIAVITGTNTINFTLPDNAVGGASYGRFRISSVGSLTPTGWSADGEVEDYSVLLFNNFIFLPTILKP